MDIRNLVERLLLFLIGVPLILALPFFTQLNFLALYIVSTVVVLIASCEMHFILSKKYAVYDLRFFLFIATLTFLLIYIFTLKKLSSSFFVILFILPLFFITIAELSASQSKDFEKSFECILTAFFIFFYPIFLASFIVLLTTIPNASILLAVFFTTVFSSDSLAWAFGMLFGNNNRGIIAVSPKKSIAGFIAVVISALLLSCILHYFLQKYFPSLVKTILLITLTSFAAVIGDLFESLLKRSSGVKDSGSIVMGRGGVLDNLDSILFAAPTYFFLSSLLL